MHWMLMPFRRVFDYSGRSSKKEFFSFFWVFWIAIPVPFAALYPAMVGYDPSRGSGWVMAAAGLYFLGLLVATIPLMVRRFHDADFSGWWLLMVFLPFAGAVALVGLSMWFHGTPGSNSYGPQPDVHARRRPRTA